MSALPKQAIPVYTYKVMTTFGERFRAHRESKGIGVNRLAAMSGVSAGHIYEVEKSTRSASENMLQKFASVKELDMSFEKFRAWQIMAKATPSELRNLLTELQKIQELHELTIHTPDGSS